MSRSASLKRASVIAAKVGAAGAVGWALASLGRGQTSAHLEFDAPVHIGRYEYEDSNCTANAQGEGTGDPVNVVFWRDTGGVYSSEVMDLVEWLAGFYYGLGDDRWFLDHGGCRYMQGQNGTAWGWEPVDRYHARYRGVQGNWVLAPTHFEEQEWTLGCGPLGIGGHAVPDEEDYGGYPWTGFLEGRQRILDAFAGPGFTFSFEWWGNDDLRRQCDNGEPWSDGWVLYVRVAVAVAAPCPASDTGWQKVRSGGANG